MSRMMWSYKETQDLLDICRERHVVQEMKLRRHNRRKIFKGIQNEMLALGHEKTPEQIFFKYKNLCGQYRRYLNTNDPKYRFPFYDRLHELLNGKPKYMKDGDGDESVDCDIKVQLNDDSAGEGEEQIDDEIMKKSPTSAKKSPTLRVRGSSIRLLTNQNYKNLFEKKLDSSEIDSETSHYISCVDYLVDKFKGAQEELQRKFHVQQLGLQRQQQEWEEKMFDVEREYFSKILGSFMQSPK